MEWKKNINANLGITIILITSVLFVLIDFYLVGSQLDGYPFNDFSKKTEIKVDYNEPSDANVSDSYISTTSINVLLGSRESYADVIVINGNLHVTFNDTNLDVIIPGEQIKYLYLDYYQYSDLNVIFALTQSGHIYVNEFNLVNSDILVFNNFKKLDYENVKDIRLVTNENYGTEDEFGVIDNKKAYLYAFINGELIKVDNQYSM